MRKGLFLILSLLSLTVFSQALIFEKDGVDISNTTIEIEVEKASILADNYFKPHYECVIKNTGSSSVNAKLKRVNVNVPDGAAVTFCAFTNCTPPNLDTLLGSLTAGATDNFMAYYQPKGNITDAVVKYELSYEGGETVTLTFNYKVVTTSISEVESNQFEAYPNPANSIVNIDYTVSEPSKIELYNIIGEKLKEETISAGSSSIQLSVADLAAGTYFYTLSNTKGVRKTKRLVVRK